MTRTLQTEQTKGTEITAGYFSKQVVSELESRSIKPETALITITDKELFHIKRQVKRRDNIKPVLSISDIEAIPAHLLNPDAVLIDKVSGGLIYGFNPSVVDKSGKLYIRVNYKKRGRVGNSLRSGGLVDSSDLNRSSDYEVIFGEL